MDNSLVSRIDRLESIHAVSQLIARYCVAVDDRDCSGVAGLFAQDCRMVTSQEVLQGRQAVFDYYRERLSSFGPSYHVPHLNTLEFSSSDEASGIAMSHVEMALGESTYIVALRYYDQYRRVQDGWAFAQREMRQLYALPVADFSNGLAKELRLCWPNGPCRSSDWPSYR